MGGTVEGVEIDSYTLGVWIGRPDGTPNPGFFGANVAAPPVATNPETIPASISGWICDV
ncbi:MAG: hypothetical protein IPH35_01665 [Rhodoferax sp.]|nr:hypothetical protein [Rhodoferax sp.]